MVNDEGEQGPPGEAEVRDIGQGHQSAKAKACLHGNVDRRHLQECAVDKMIESKIYVPKYIFDTFSSLYFYVVFITFSH